MRPAFLVLALLAAGCAPAQRPASASPAAIAARAERQAMADSLLALPPDSLSAAELDWLALYYTDRQQAELETELAARRGSSASRALGIGLLVAAIGGPLLYIVLTE